MKKTGFTLAEVLITLAIIGVVATLTLPALMTNTAEQQAKTALKKGINTLTEAAQMNQAISGFDYASVNTKSVDASQFVGGQSLFGILEERTQVDHQRSLTSGGGGTTGNAEVFFRDGSSLIFPADIISTTASGTAMQEDRLVYGMTAVYDTNGSKGPNYLSNCSGNAAMALPAAKATAGDVQHADEDCSVRANRVIKDRFGVRLRGGFVVPNSPAAKWAYDN